MGESERRSTTETHRSAMNKMITKKNATSMILGGGKKKAAAKKTTPRKTGTVRQGGVGYKKFEGRPLYLPDIEPPAWLDGSMIGDRGFDPLGLSKPTEYIQMGIDQLDQNKAINKMGGVVGTITPDVDQVSGDSLSPYSEAFGIQRFRECELIHGRWCMLATLGIIVSEGATGISWQNAGLAELDQAQYPGGTFDPLGFASDAEKSINLKEAEIRHCRLAMVAMFGIGTQALLFNKGALESLSTFGNSFSGA